MPIEKTILGIILTKGRNDTYDPPTGQSSRWKHWMTEKDDRVCTRCEQMQGKIYSLYETLSPTPPLHPNCRCKIEVMKTVIFLPPPEEYGTKQILTTTMVNETIIALFGQAMA